MANKNKNADKECHCFNPRPKENSHVGLPFTIIDVEVEDIRIPNQLSGMLFRSQL